MQPAAVLCAVTLAAPLACRGAATPRGAPPPMVELRVEQGLPFVQAQMQAGSRTALGWMLIDTGAGDFTLIDPATARTLELRHEPQSDPEAPWLGVRARLDALTLADGLRRAPWTLHVVPLQSRTDLKAIPIAGVLGTAVLRGQQVVLDLDRKRFGTGRVPVPRGADWIPLAWGEQGTLLCEIRVVGRTLRAYLDTGSSFSQLGARAAAALSVPTDPAAAALPQRTLRGQEPVRSSAPLAVEVGARRVADFRFLLVDDVARGADALLGMDLLSRFWVLLDLGTEPRMLLEPGGGPPWAPS